MAVTLTRVQGTEMTAGRMRAYTFDITFTGTYPTGGETINPKDAGLLGIVGVQFLGGNSAAATLMYDWDTANSKLLVLYPTGGGAASPAALADPVVGAGAGASTVITPGRGKEVANATVLTTLSIRCMFWGFQ